MKPFPLYHLHAEAFTALKSPLVDIVVKAAAPDLIFLLGAALHHRRSESIFTGSAPSAQYIGHCALLVLLPHLGGRELHEWQDKIETHCAASLLPATVLVVHTGRFKGWLEEGDRFARHVNQAALVLYDAGTATLPPPGQTAPPFPGKATENEHATGLRRAAEFLAGAELFRLRRQGAMAAFMLHQAAEQCLHTLVKTGTGYSPNTHSLDRLLRYAALVSCRVPDLFPQQTERDKRLFNLLRKAYIDTRYNDYSISEDDLDTLARRVQTLRDLVAGFGEQLFSSQPATTRHENE